MTTNITANITQMPGQSTFQRPSPAIDTPPLPETTIHAKEDDAMQVFAEQSAPYVDYLLLADRAEALNGKLYMMGGGWDRLGVGDFNQPVVLCIALGMVVPWNATNKHHTLALQIEDADGSRVAQVNAQFVTGRPPQIEEGASQRLPMVINIGCILPGPGVYAVVAEMNDQESKRITFTAAPVPRSPTGPGTLA
jgi:hypothetical protein